MSSSFGVEENSRPTSPEADERPEDVPSHSPTEKVQLWPIFSWKAETTDGLPTAPSTPYDRVPDQYKDTDGTIREILAECDIKALWYVKYEGELPVLLNICDSSRMNLATHMERIHIGLMQLEESDQLAKKRESWALKQKVISSALGILNAFVPVHYQDINQYWLIKKFFGALMRIADENVRHYTAESPIHGAEIQKILMKREVFRRIPRKCRTGLVVLPSQVGTNPGWCLTRTTWKVH